jgi:hypothetical protein
LENLTFGQRVVEAVGDRGARELLDALTRPQVDRARLIGRLSQREDGSWLSDVLIDLEMDEVARLTLVAGLRQALSQES